VARWYRRGTSRSKRKGRVWHNRRSWAQSLWMKSTEPTVSDAHNPIGRIDGARRSDGAMLGFCSSDCADHYATATAGDEDDLFQDWVSIRPNGIECLHCAWCGTVAYLPERGTCFHHVGVCPGLNYWATLHAREVLRWLSYLIEGPVPAMLEQDAEMWWVNNGTNFPPRIAAQSLYLAWHLTGMDGDGE
jgi:hypothetical protein